VTYANKFIRTSMFVFLITLCLCLPAMAGQHLAYEVTKNAYQRGGETVPASVDTMHHWLDGKNARTDGDKNTTYLYHGETGLIYTINHDSRTYNEIEQGAFKKLLEKHMGPDAGEAAERMMSMFQIKSSVTPTEETKKIGNYDCTKYVFELTIASPVKHTIWATKDLAVDMELYSIANNAMQALLPGFDGMITELNKIGGVPVESSFEANFQGILTSGSSRLLNYEEVDLGKDKFAIPEGYAKEEIQLPGMGG